MTLDQIALKHQTDKASLWHGYCPIYERYFDKWRNEPITLLEIGVLFGCSIKTWLEYFPRAQIIGVDGCHDYQGTDPRYTFLQGDAGKESFWATVPQQPLTIVIDDGGHHLSDIAPAHKCLWPRVVSGGLYIVEDWFTMWHTFFNPPNVGDAWIANLTGTLNDWGLNFIGRPGLSVAPSPPCDIAFVHLYRGLVIIGKK